MAMRVSKDNNQVHIQWRVADITIPNNDIKEVKEDQEIHALSKEDQDHVVRIGSTFGKTNRVIIKTDEKEYIIYTHADKKIYNELTKEA
ncbi:hypothetical protein [Mammaliicoccus sp. Dog046]|uniref:SunI/YnzG family protein n=1 Tax=Mammaliicoccus sp. Dog046 TaxID=3034233 RepID=UPI002B25DDF4|nr:hypothetical protein [Mammaliicoccus sp. Dog046]WQK85837.1 hypothetical protein P3U32_02025 [Mammaliicoccus sp. Dog046]